MAARRYWRVILMPQSLANGVMLSTLEVRAAVGGADITGMATRSMPSNQAAWFDGNSGTEAYAFIGGDGRYVPAVTYDFGGPQVLAEVYVRSGSNGGLAPAYVQVAASDDGAHWTWCAPAFDTSTMGANAAVALSGFSEASLAPRVAGAPMRLADNWPSDSPAARTPVQVLHYDAQDGGPYRVAGDVGIDGSPVVPVSRQVLLLAADTLRPVREAWSDPATGAFSFAGLRYQRYITVARDYSGAYESVAADMVLPVL